MQTFLIHRMKEMARASFRTAPHTAGLAQVKPKDYEPGSSVEAASVYGAWADLSRSEQPLEVGDVLESADGSLKIYKYVGFEDARWILPEVKTGVETLPGAAGGLLDVGAPA